MREEVRYAGFDNVVPPEQNGFVGIDTFIDIQSLNPRNRGVNARRYDWVVRNNGAKLLNLENGDYQDVKYIATNSTGSSSLVESISSSVSPTANAISFWMKVDVPTTYGTADSLLTTLVVNGDGTGTPSGNSAGGIALAVDYTLNTVEGKNTWIESDGTTMDVYGDGLKIGTDFGTGDVGVELQNAFDGEWHHYIWTLQPTATTKQNVEDFYYELNSAASQDHDIEFEFADIRILNDKVDATTAWYLYTNPEEIFVTPVWGTSIPEYWVSYKAALTVDYGNASGETPNVPLEWFSYGVHGAYADWLRAEGQTDKARVEEGYAREHLEKQLEKITRTNRSPYIWSRFSTHGTRQYR